MATVELTNNEIIDLVRRLPAERQRELLLALAGGQEARDKRMQLAEDQLRRIATQRGADWNSMNDDQRQALVDDLIHEDRPCQR
jgi:hypothetical protein